MKLLKVKKEKVGVSGAAPLLDLKMSPPIFRVAKLEARLGQSRSLPSSLVSKLLTSVLPSGSSTSTLSRSPVPLLKPSLDNGKGLMVTEKASLVSSKKKDPASDSEDVLKAFREACSDAGLLQLMVLSPLGGIWKGFCAGSQGIN